MRSENIKIITGDARFLMRELFADESFDRVQMNFPCPWPKERHSKRRVTSPEFAGTLASVLKVGGCFELMTDDEVYAQDARDTLSGHGSLELMSYERDPDRPFRTKYERKWLGMGRGIWRVRIRKSAPFTTERIIYKVGEDRMHIRLEDMESGGAVAAKFDALFGQGGPSELGGKSSEDGVHWVFKNHFCESSGDVHLIETISSDAGFEQKYYLKVVFRDEGGKNTVLVKVDGNSQVFLTPSVRHALSDLAERVKS